MKNSVEVPTKEQLEKYEKLKEYLASFGSVAVAFSSGVDSALLLFAAKEALGDRAIAVTAVSGAFPKRELTEAKEFCAEHGILQEIVEFHEMEVEGFRENPKNRCYICKKALFQEIMKAAASHGIDTVAEGSNLDDLGDYRPGLTAIAELGIESPLRACGLTKSDIRALSKHFGLPTWSKPSYACLASRFVYGETITEKKLSMVDRAEQLLLDLGFLQIRVRIHGMMARIEVLPEEFPKLLENRLLIVKSFKEYGFTYVSMDLAGYRTGSMNETILP
ncbi:MAG: ATP-dependent sacrificial sulfur transferase LarE [Lachnospiraceae bacterium]|nr:ATP-dependent sacrificial sulfur transferase LarE [Lachnospiraceae bacterium]